MTCIFLNPAMSQSRHNHTTTPLDGHSTKPPNYMLSQALPEWSRWKSNLEPSEYKSDTPRGPPCHPSSQSALPRALTRSRGNCKKKKGRGTERLGVAFTPRFAELGHAHRVRSATDTNSR